jgi:diguanylate cyclase (GGDEF)-like protein
VAVEKMVFNSDKNSFGVTISIGVAPADETETGQLEDVIKRADQALYSSKHNGRNRVSVYEGESVGEGEGAGEVKEKDGN